MCYTHFSCILVCCLTFAFKINLVISFFLFLKIGILNFKTMWIYLDFGSQVHRIAVIIELLLIDGRIDFFLSLFSNLISLRTHYATTLLYFIFIIIYIYIHIYPISSSIFCCIHFNLHALFRL